MRSRFNSEYYQGIREDLLEEVANEYIKTGMNSEEAWEKAEEDTPSAYEMWESDAQEYADIQCELARDRAMGL